MNTTSQPIIVRNSLTCTQAAMLVQQTGQTVQQLQDSGQIAFEWYWSRADVGQRLREMQTRSN